MRYIWLGRSLSLRRSPGEFFLSLVAPFFTMEISKRLRSSTLITYLALLFGSGFAQRPSSASVCDYYAQARFGANSSETQLKFIQNVVVLAFEGGSRLNNVSSEITGILRPGKFNGADISLLQYFNGSRASTNVNNAPIGINWMDQGGTTPLAAFLAGDTQKLGLAEGSNQQYVVTRPACRSRKLMLTEPLHH